MVSSVKSFLWLPQAPVASPSVSSDLAPAQSVPGSEAAWSGWVQPQPRTRKPRLSDVLWQHQRSLLYHYPSQQNRAQVWGNEGWFFRAGGGGWWWRNWALFRYWFIGPVSWTASVQSPVRQPWPPTACHTGNARPGMGPSCCLPNVANLFLNQTSQLKDENKKFSIALNFGTRDQLSHHLRTKSSYFQQIKGFK